MTRTLRQLVTILLVGGYALLVSSFLVPADVGAEIWGAGLTWPVILTFYVLPSLGVICLVLSLWQRRFWAAIFSIGLIFSFWLSFGFSQQLLGG